MSTIPYRETQVLRSESAAKLVKRHDVTTTFGVDGFSAALNRMSLAARKILKYDQGREMARHVAITQNTGVAIYFRDPHSPWQKGSNENINGLIYQYLLKGTDLSLTSQEELDAIAFELNMRPRKRFAFKCPIEVVNELMAQHNEAPHSIRLSIALKICIRFFKNDRYNSVVIMPLVYIMGSCV